MKRSIVSKVRARRLIHMVLVAVTKELSETNHLKEDGLDLFKIQDPPTTAGRVHQSSSSRDVAGSKAERKELGLRMTFQVTLSYLQPGTRYDLPSYTLIPTPST